MDHIVQFVSQCLPCLILENDIRQEKIHDVDQSRGVHDVSSEILDVLNRAEKGGKDLQRTLEDVVGESGWTETIAQALLKQLEQLIRAGAPMGQAVKDAFEKAMAAAVGFAHDHPVFCTLIALGILAVLTPWVIEVLGFGELGPIEGKFDR